MVRKMTRLALAARGGDLGASGLGLAAARACAERPKRLEKASQPKPQEMLLRSARRVKIGVTELHQWLSEWLIRFSLEIAELGGVVECEAEVGPGLLAVHAGL